MTDVVSIQTLQNQRTIEKNRDLYIADGFVPEMPLQSLNFHLMRLAKYMHLAGDDELLEMVQDFRIKVLELQMLRNGNDASGK